MSYQYSSNLLNKSCSDFENQNDIYAFNIKIINNDEQIIKKNLVSLDKIGELLECKNNIKKIKITFCLLNSNFNSIETIILKKTINQEINEPVILLKKNIIIYINTINDNNISINYQII